MGIKWKQSQIKLCPRESQTCMLVLICDCDLEINPHHLETQRWPRYSKDAPYTENEADTLRHSKLRAWTEKVEKCLKVRDQGQNVKISE